MRIKTVDGWSDFEGIEKTIVNKLLKFYFNDNTTLTCTEEHKIFKELDLPIWACLLSENETIINANNEKIKINKIEEIEGEFEVFDIINVDLNNRFICNNINVSNCDEFWSSNYPVLSSFKNSKAIIISTPNGMFNLFSQIYNDARTIEEQQEYENALKLKDPEYLQEVILKQGKKNAFIKAKFDWKSVPWRTQEWADTEKSNIGETRFAQEFDCQFLGSTFTLIKTETLERILKTSNKEPELIDLQRSPKNLWTTYTKHTIYFRCRSI